MIKKNFPTINTTQLSAKISWKIKSSVPSIINFTIDKRGKMKFKGMKRKTMKDKRSTKRHHLDSNDYKKEERLFLPWYDFDGTDIHLC